MLSQQVNAKETSELEQSVSVYSSRSKGRAKHGLSAIAVTEAAKGPDLDPCGKLSGAEEESARAAVQTLHWSKIALRDRSLAGRDRSHQAGLAEVLGATGPWQGRNRPENTTLGTGLSGKDRSPGDRSLRQGPVPEREISSAREGSSRGPVSPSWDRSLAAKTAQ
uniref:Uncharacterized protein n=1 Tax=Ananas comosus var. bracteatus TaxID=296719 RepID=A0A6V7NTT2_ANACO|nr:unnamed protein product [Ananas comosus var. bracteatus]